MMTINTAKKGTNIGQKVRVREPQEGSITTIKLDFKCELIQN